MLMLRLYPERASLVPGLETRQQADLSPPLLLGWSFLEGMGAALIMPAIVALVAGNFSVERAPRRTASSRPLGRSRSPSAR
jgi:MFS family permease